MNLEECKLQCALGLLKTEKYVCWYSLNPTRSGTPYWSCTLITYYNNLTYTGDYAVVKFKQWLQQNKSLSYIYHACWRSANIDNVIVKDAKKRVFIVLLDDTYFEILIGT